jgi:pimeloyl-ACP methyl ester carboxylesterase
VVLLHALGESAADWEPVAARLAESYHLLAFDLRGHGSSEWHGDYSSRVMSEDVVDAIERLGLGPVILVGHSLGGIVAMLVALARPDLVRRLVIEDVVPPYDRDRPAPERPEGVELPFDWPVVPAIVVEAGRRDAAFWDDLGRLEAPTLLIYGGDDSHIPQTHVAEAAARIPDSTLVTIPAGHYVHAARPEEFTEAVLRWLSGA